MKYEFNPTNDVTLLDYFAGQIVQGFIVKNGMTLTEPQIERIFEVAQMMLMERQEALEEVADTAMALSIAEKKQERGR
jgi:hypothetical protein